MAKKKFGKMLNGYKGLYMVSNTGKIKALPKFHKTNKDYSSIGYMQKEKILSVYYDKKSGYGRIGLTKNGKTNRKYIHRLVAEAFIPNPENKSEVNHIDENKENNNIENLEWCDRKYNNNYGNRNKYVSKKLSKSIIQKDLNNNIIKIWDSISDVGKELEISTSHISSCCNKKRHTTGGFRWEFNDGGKN